MVGESIPDEVVFTTALTSCSISSCTLPLSLMRGVTERITPVSCMVIELTMAVLAVTVLVAVWVVIGTWSPRRSVTCLPSSARSDGLKGNRPEIALTTS